MNLASTKKPTKSAKAGMGKNVKENPAASAQSANSVERNEQVQDDNVSRSARSREGDVPSAAAAEQAQAQQAVTQMGAKSRKKINEGGRTNDSHSGTNPPHSVGAVPTPAIRGTWR